MVRQGARRKNILHGSLTDEQRCRSVKDRQPFGRSAGRPLAALLLSHPATAGRLCSFVAPCQQPASVSRTHFRFMRSVPGRKFDRRAYEGTYQRTSTQSRGLGPAHRTEIKQAPAFLLTSKRCKLAWSRKPASLSRKATSFTSRTGKRWLCSAQVGMC